MQKAEGKSEICMYEDGTFEGSADADIELLKNLAQEIGAGKIVVTILGNHSSSIT